MQRHAEAVLQFLGLLQIVAGQASRQVGQRIVEVAVVVERFDQKAQRGAVDLELWQLDLGADTVQVCTGVMVHGYELVKSLTAGLSAFMDRHNFKSIAQFKGHSLQYFTTHADLVQRQAAARAPRSETAGVVTQDTQWRGDQFVQQTEKLVANE